MQLTVSSTGSLAYLPGPVVQSGQLDVALFDSKGIAQPLGLTWGADTSPRVSPGGRRLAVATEDSRQAIVWVYALDGTTAIRRLTLVGRNRAPMWSADGQRVIFQSDSDGQAGIVWQRADGTGTPERLTTAERGAVHIPESVSRDGKYLLFEIAKERQVTVWTYAFADGKVAPFSNLRSAGSLLTPSFSPTADGSSTPRSYPIPKVSAARLCTLRGAISGDGERHEIGPGVHPLWSRDGKEIFMWAERHSPARWGT